MVSWSGFEALEPEFSSRVRALLLSRRHLTLATLRRDGAPRISGTECAVVDGELVVGMMPGSLKALDLLRDPRVALHGPTCDPDDDDPAGWPGEAKLSGAAVELPSEGPGHSFRIDIREVSTVRVVGPPYQLLIESWSPEKGFLERRRE